MIRFDHVTFAYAGAPPVLRDVNLNVGEGELALVAGPTGAGKSTLLRCVNGLVPHFTGGTLAGEVRVDGASTRHRPPGAWAQTVAYVAQEPRSSFVTDRVEDELAYGMEQLGIAPSVMRTRVEDTLDLLGIADLRAQSVSTLSGGEAQRVAIGAALAAGPRVLVLDEPTSALDPGAAEDVLAALARLVHDLGLTVLMAEHRLERAIQFADTMIQVAAGGTVTQGPPAVQLATAQGAPPVVQLGRLLGWEPLPLTIRDARRRAGLWRARLAEPASQPAPAASEPPGRPAPTANEPPDAPRPVVAAVRHLTVAYGDFLAVRDVSFDLHRGEITALMGRNGSGKSSLLWAMRGVGPRHAGTVTVLGTDPADVHPGEARGLAALVPDEAADLLYLDTVAAETAQAGARALLARLAPDVDLAAHPRDLSSGQRLALVLALQLASSPPVVLLDEPTRGLDYAAKARFAALLGELAAEGRAVLVATHDVEFAAVAAQRVLTLAQGELITDGPAVTALGASPAHAPQVARVLGADAGVLTVADVAARLGLAAPRP
jgi:energy-coupling factor transport system ATP-binding protein